MYIFSFLFLNPGLLIYIQIRAPLFNQLTFSDRLNVNNLKTKMVSKLSVLSAVSLFRKDKEAKTAFLKEVNLHTSSFTSHYD